MKPAPLRITILACLPLVAAAPAKTALAAPAADPCAGPQKRTLRCPNLRIGPPSELYVEQRGGRTLLRATSDVRSRGLGPIEVHGRRNGWRSMSVRQRIYRKGGGHIDVPTRASLRFTEVGAYFGGGYWKFHQLARFELWRVDGRRRLLRRVRTGPKLNYCLRDLERTRPGRRSPEQRHYPACNRNPYEDRVRLGTSVGWSDIYPAPYHQQWIQVGGLRGCFAFLMTVDPLGLLYESNETDNTSRRLIHLPYPGRSGCQPRGRRD